MNKNYYKAKKKFTGEVSNLNTWVYGHFFYNAGKCYMMSDNKQIMINEKTLCQRMLTTKVKGESFYENDIVVFTLLDYHEGDTIYMGSILWESNKCRYVIKIDENNMIPIYEVDMDTASVIGNIYNSGNYFIGGE